MIISPIVARQYILGHQGLWPGRRVAIKDGAATIIHQIGGVQLDPSNVVARSHDIEELPYWRMHMRRKVLEPR